MIGIEYIGAALVFLFLTNFKNTASNNVHISTKRRKRRKSRGRRDW